jgi:hypothetical protein
VAGTKPPASYAVRWPRPDFPVAPVRLMPRRSKVRGGKPARVIHRLVGGGVVGGGVVGGGGVGRRGVVCDVVVDGVGGGAGAVREQAVRAWPRLGSASVWWVVWVWSGLGLWGGFVVVWGCSGLGCVVMAWVGWGVGPAGDPDSVSGWVRVRGVCCVLVSLN